MQSNKHLIVAFIVGPLLAILAWYAVGRLVGERAAPAVSGEAYPLLEKSDCRYASGHCKLENQDFKLVLSIEHRGMETVLVLASSHILEGVMVSVALPDSVPEPTAMYPDGKQWIASLKSVPELKERIYLVASGGGSQYFGDAATLFIKRE